jgi:hypothetical protein
MLTTVLFVLVAATLWAAVARFYRLHILPPPAWFDEVWYALRAREILHTGRWPVFYKTDFGGANAGPVYMAVLSQWVGFRGITTARVVPALTGTLSIPLAYACYRELLMAGREGRPDDDFSPGERCWIAALTALVLAYTLFYVTIGRMGMENGVAPSTALFVVWQMMRGIRRRAWSGWLLGGLVLGVAQYNGLHARFILPLVAFIGLQALFAARPGDRRPILLGGAVMAAVAVLAALPLILFFVSNPGWFLGRASIVTHAGPGTPYPTLADMYKFNARVIFRVFSLEGSYDPKNGVPGVPLLDPIQSAGFVIGLVWSVVRFRRSALARTLLVWLVLMLLTSFLTEGAPNIGRMIGIAPPTAALVALGWVKGFGWLWAKITPGLAHRLLSGAAAVLVLISVIRHTYLLFVEWPKVSNLREQFTALPVDIANDMIARADDDEPTFVELLPEADQDIVAFAYLLPGTPVTRMDLRKCLPLPHQNVTRVSYVVLSGRDLQTVDTLTALYPESATPLLDVDLFQTTGTLVEVPPGATAPPPPHRPTLRFANGIALYGFDWSGDSLRPGETLFLTFYWYTDERVEGDLIAFIHVGTGVDGQLFVAQRDDQPCMGFYRTSQWQPGLVVPDSFAITLAEDVPPGDYDLVVGWYGYPSLERVPIVEADSSLPDHRAVVGTIHVAP